jgi:hypothetical protein
MAIENEDQVSVLEGGDGRGAAPKTPEVSALLRAPTTASDIAGKMSGITGIGRRAEAASREMPGVLQQATEAELEATRAETAIKKAGLEQAARAEKEVLKRARGSMEAAEKEIKPYQEFVQPQYKASDYAANAAARLFTGLMLGGVAKMSAIGQLQAIRDMQKAEDQGLREEFNAARIKFEEAEKARKDFNADIKERLDRVMKLLPYDRNAALAESKIIESKLLDGAAVASAKRGDTGRVMKFLEADIEGGRKLEQALAQAKIRAESRQPAAGQIFFGTDDKGNQVPILIDPRTGQTKVVPMPEGVKGLTKPSGKLQGDASVKQKPTAKITDEFSRAKESVDDVADVLEKINNPKVREQWAKANQVLGRFLAEVSSSKAQGDSILRRYIASEAIKNLNPEVRSLFVSIATARNNYYKLQSGTAVSGAEAARNFGAVIQPTDDLETLRTKAYQVANRAMQKINDDLNAYQFAPRLEESIQKRVDYLKNLTKVVEVNGKLYKRLDDGTYEEYGQPNAPEKK